MNKLIDSFLIIIFWGSGLILLAGLIAIITYLFIQGGSALSLDFLRLPPAGSPLGKEGGVLPAIKGTLYLIGIALTVTAIPAFFTAIYLSEYAQPSPLLNTMEVLIQSMAGVPSIIIGLFVYALCVVQLGWGISLLAGGVALSIMIFPVIVVSMRDSLRAVDRDYRLTGAALGVSPAYMLRRIILPQSWRAIIGSILLALGYAAGATAPIMVTAAAISAPASGNLFDPVMALPYHLYLLFNEHISLDNAYATALLLVIMLLILNSAALALTGNSSMKKRR
jgi:phosphate transport system permease protein